MADLTDVSNVTDAEGMKKVLRTFTDQQLAELASQWVMRQINASVYTVEIMQGICNEVYHRFHFGGKAS